MPVDGEYGPSPRGWVREQVEQYESSGGTEGTTLRDTGLPVVIIIEPRRAQRQAAQDPGDAGRARRPVRRGRVAGRRSDEPALVLQLPRGPARRAAGRPAQAGHGGPGGNRGRAGPVVGARGRGVPAVR